MASSTQTTPAPAKTAWWASEDWAAVWIGAVVLGVILLGYRPSVPALKWSDSSGLLQLFGPDRLLPWLAIGGVTWLLSLPGVAVQKLNLVRYSLGFPVVFALAWLAQLLAGNKISETWGFEYVVFALGLGLLISNTVGTPEWLLHAARTEFFIKTGLVTMGATLLFREILQAGALGIIQSVVVVIVVWYVSFWIAKKLRLDDEFAAMLSTAVSICGVSAAIAACGAIQGDRKKLGYTTSIVLIVAAPMIIVQPWIARTAGLPDLVAGAWLGGTLDTTGSVVAAGALISETAMKVGTIVKFSQNVLIGLAAFALSLWWTLRSKQAEDRPSASVIWERFPKFVLGFMAASLVFSFLLDSSVVAATKGAIGTIRTVWFALAFVSIGLETRFTELISMENGRPFLTFVSAQTFNLIWTLLLAWLVFGGVVVPAPEI
ncbi:MAG: putative sulfate exporter family transporter [Bryobacteraceae bacterium]|nr:putative sulfate exporter family transporter [Bryobacteraceae bacterium]